MNLAYYRRLAVNLENAFRLWAGSVYPAEVEGIVTASKRAAAGHAGGVASPRGRVDDAEIYDILAGHGLSAVDAATLAQQISAALALAGGGEGGLAVAEWQAVAENTGRLLEQERYSDGVIVALYPDTEAARALAIPGGLEPEALHLTLAFLGTVDDYLPEDVERLLNLGRALAVILPPLAGTINGGGAFCGDDGEVVAVYASPDVPALSDFRGEAVASLAASGFQASSAHGFIPHIALSYDPDTALPPDGIGRMPVRFTRLSVVAGAVRRDFPLLGGPVREAIDRYEYAGSPAIVLQVEDAEELEAGAEATLERFRVWAAEEHPAMEALLDAKAI